MATVAEQVTARKRELGIPQGGMTVREQVDARLQERDSDYDSAILGTPHLDKGYPDPPPGYADRNPPATPRVQTSQTEQLGRNLQIGTQGVGRGLAGLLGLPVNLTEMAGNAGLTLADYLSDGGVPFRIEDSVCSSGQIADTAGQGMETLFGDVLLDQADMTPDERMRYAINQFGTEGAVGGTLTSQLRHLLPRSLTASYDAPGSAARIVVGDRLVRYRSERPLSAHRDRKHRCPVPIFKIFSDRLRSSAPAPFPLPPRGRVSPCRGSGGGGLVGESSEPALARVQCLSRS